MDKFKAGVSKTKNNNMEPLKLLQISEFINEEEIVSFISKKINSIIDYNEENKVKQKKGAQEYIHSSFIPVTSIEGFLVAYLNIIKLLNKENFILTNNNIYILLLASCTLSKKFLEDLLLENSYYCQIGPFTAEELNLAEYRLSY